MAITAADLLTPTGGLTPELLTGLRPSASVNDTATDYATAGNAKVAGWSDAARADRAATAWAHYRALSDRAQQILTAAASLSSDDGARSYSSAQAVELKKDGSEWLAQFEAALAEEQTAGAAAPLPPATSASTSATFGW